ncbi:MAG: zf-TFIIB domain-containing protein [Phycisphaerae bacterium]|nr:zf-TFIIB domain-containing protein [Phycisphaerae bacterium]
MDCPICKSAMIVLELEQVEVDHCTACGGIWLDAGELELLFNDARQAKQLVSSFHHAPGVKEKVRSCPICLKKMQKIHAGGFDPFGKLRAGKLTAGSEDEPVIIDRCPKGHGLWFDRGELPQVLAKGSFDKERKVIKLLSQIFGGGSEVKNGG